METRGQYGTEKLNIREETTKLFDQGYSPPKPEEVLNVKKCYSLTGKQIADICGVHGSRTVRKWTAVMIDGEKNKNYQQIPYAAWRLLLQHLKVV